MEKLYDGEEGFTPSPINRLEMIEMLFCQESFRKNKTKDLRQNRN